MGQSTLTLRSALLGLIALTALTTHGDAQTPWGNSGPNIQFQPRPQFQNQPTSPCTTGPIRRSASTPLGDIQENGEMLEVYVNDTTIQAMNYVTGSSHQMLRYIKVNLQFRDAADPLQYRTENVMLDGRGQFVLLSRSGPRANPYYLTEGALRQNVDGYLRSIPPGSAYSMLEQHLQSAGCF
jgi:hypothetical protein